MTQNSCLELFSSSKTHLESDVSHLNFYLALFFHEKRNALTNTWQQQKLAANCAGKRSINKEVGL